MKKHLLVTFIAALSINTYAQVPTNGLVGYWPFNGNANDYSGRGNNGTLYGATAATDRFGNAGMAYSFNGINNYIEVLDNISLRPANITISSWVNVSSGTTIKEVMEKVHWADATNEEYAITLSVNGSSNYPSSGIKSNSSCSSGGWVTCYANAATMLNNTWYNVVMTYDGAFMKLYLNCVLVGTQTGTEGIDNCPGGDLEIGRSWASAPYYFNGLLDDIRIYNRALDATEIKTLCSEIFNAVDEFKNGANSVNIFPNPTNGVFSLQSSERILLVETITLLGETVYSTTLNSNKTTIDLSNQKSGIYFLQITSDKGMTRKTIVITK